MTNQISEPAASPSSDASKEVEYQLPPEIIRKAVLASIIGNGLEWYDYLLYGFFAYYIKQAFFPAEDAFISTLLVFAVFSISFFLRPIGGILLGIYSDRVGRKPALTLMIFMMGIATVLIAITPSYATIGIAAPIIVILARILQGLSVGGEFGGATAMLVEYAPKNKRLFYGSFQMVSQALATVLAAGLGLLVITTLNEQQTAQWGWRILFLLGGLIAPIGFYIRHQVPETPQFIKLKETKTISKTPIKDLFTQHPRALIAGLGLVAIGGASNYIWFVYMTIYVVEELHLPIRMMFISDLVAGLVLLVLNFIIGRWCDRLGGWRVFVTGVILFGACAFPLFAYVIAEPGFERLLTVQVIGAAIMSLIWAPTPGIFAALFPANVRATGMSLSYNTGVLLFGAVAPILLTILIKYTGDLMMPAYYIIFCACLSLILMRVAKKAIQNPYIE
ncbi:MAG: MFS transporter [Robiginitomaculum sp.]|nr:MAG: MFS transporter [Robiginitomaculum sp.]